MPDAPHLITMSCIAKHGVVSLSFFLFLLLSPTLSTAQPNTGQQPNDGYPYARFSPTMAIIIVVLVAALFFMGLFSIYIRNCSESGANGSAVRPVAGGTGRSRRGTRGLEASVIETFPTMVYSEVKDHKIGKGALECAVCLNEFEDDETLRLIPKCDHVFHPDCIDAWLASHTTCPVCRANLAPQPDDPVSQPTELDSATTTEVDIEAPSTAGESETEEGRRNANCDVEAQVPPPEVEVISLNRTLNRNRTRGSRSSRTRRLFFPRSHSTGHSFVQQGENTDRFTLRLPADVRKQLMKRELNRTMSMVVLPRERSSRRGFRGGDDGGSNRGGRSFKRLEKLDQGAKSDRWVFTMAPPFFSRASSMKSPRVAADDGEGTSSRPVGPAGESSRPPV